MHGAQHEDHRRQAVGLFQPGTMPSPSPTEQTVPMLDVERVSILPEKKHSLYTFAQKGIIGDEERLELRKTGVYRFFPRCMRLKFAESQQESLYEAYYTSQKQSDLVAFVVAAIAYNSFCAIEYSTRGLDLVRPSHLAALIFLILAFLFNCGVIGFYKLQIAKLKEQIRFKQLFPLSVFAILYVSFFLDLLATHDRLLRSDGVSFQILFIYVTMTMLPLRFSVCSSLALLSSGALLLIHGIWGYSIDATSAAVELCAAAALYAGTFAVGLLAAFVADKKQRRAFRQARITIAMKLVLEQQSQEQERLLLAVLPKHLAQEIRRDLGSEGVHGQFKKIYMQHYSGVSILFADIVGFTALSSQCTAAELVKLLNKLIARFDKLSEKYHQLRIKILGDCYYCVSGAPEPRKDHAVLCCHMGLAMVEAIRAVREETNSGVDMRVGIHTGSILAGVMGQKQYAYDVYSKDTKLANAMESGGKPGRVHISETTLACLNGEFEVEPGEGETRNEEIKKSGLQTYLISQTLKKYPEGTLDADKGRLSVANDPPLSTRRASQRPKNGYGGGMGGEEEDFDNRLQQALIEREGATLKSKANYVTLSFTDQVLEAQYAAMREKLGPALITAILFLVVLSCFVHGLLWNFVVGTGVAYGAAIVILLGVSSLAWATTKNQMYPEKVVSFIRWTVEMRSLRFVWLAGILLVAALPEIVDRISCTDPARQDCEPPIFYIHLTTLLLMGATIFTQLGHLTKFLMMAVLVTVHSVFSPFVQELVFDDYDRKTLDPLHFIALKTKYTAICILILIWLALYFVNRHAEITARLLFVWKNESDAQKEQVSDLRRRNEELVHNILPPHVAMHFLSRNSAENEEPYSEHHSEVGVMFASMPNFADNYTEDSINKNGIEWLRFLNEVISDYDELLDDKRFQGTITKIKTIGATYMVASGLTNTDVYDENTSHRDRFRHLDRLVRFALAMREKLHTINENSFNQFYLRIGINSGPISAGVIGVRKPHYDIWGDTVNVASRMESTGPRDSIQVEEKTKNLLTKFGYEFESLGLVKVKGKGELSTYRLLPPASELPDGDLSRSGSIKNHSQQYQQSS